MGWHRGGGRVHERHCVHGFWLRALHAPLFNGAIQLSGEVADPERLVEPHRLFC
jgi:hypothetical protein